MYLGRSFMFKSIIILLMLSLVLANGSLFNFASFADESENQGEKMLPYVVKFKQPAGDKEKKIIESLGGKVILAYKTGELRKWLAIEIPGKAVNELRDNTNVLFVEDNSEITLKTPQIVNSTSEVAEVEKLHDDKMNKSNDESSSLAQVRDTYLDYAIEVGADKAHAAGITGKGVTIAHIGFGVDKDHPELKISKGIGLYPGASFDDYDDEDGHGTACIGIYNMQNNGHGYVGIAPDADVVVYKVIKDGSWSEHLMASAFDSCAQLKHDIVQVSIKDNMYRRGQEYGNLIRDAIKSAQEAGCLVVCALGNQSMDLSDESDYRRTVEYPALWKEYSIGVSNIDNNEEIYSGSNYGNGYVDFCAPGVYISTTNNQGGYSTYTGTSFSCPVVCGVAALYKQRFPDLKLEDVLKATSEDLGEPGYDQYYGYGKVRWMEVFPEN